MRIWCERICRWAVVGVFLWAAGAKSLDLAAFARTIGDFGLVWPGWAAPAAVAMLAAEFVAGGLLFCRRRAGYVLAAALLVAYTAVIAYGIAIGLDIECGCLGPADRWAAMSLQASLVRNLCLLVALAAAWFLRPPRRN